MRKRLSEKRETRNEKRAQHDAASTLARWGGWDNFDFGGGGGIVIGVSIGISESVTVLSILCTLLSLQTEDDEHPMTIT